MNREPQHDAEQRTGEPEHEGLEHIDTDDLRRPRAEALHHCNGVHALLKVGVHRGGDAERTDDQRDQADQAEERGGAVEAARNERMRLAEIGNEAGRETAAENGARFGDADAVFRQAEEEALRGAATRDEQVGALEALAADHEAGTDIKAPGHAVGLSDDDGGDAVRGFAEADGIADVFAEPEEKVLGDDDGLRSEAVAKARRAGRAATRRKTGRARARRP